MVKIKPFKLERYFAKYEFAIPYLLCCSDCEPLSLRKLLDMADPETKDMWENLRLGYTESLGHPLLREEIANLYSNITENNVLIVVPEEGIYIAMNVLLEEGDHVICTFPGYQSLYQIADTLGCEVTRWEPDIDGEWKFRSEFLASSIQDNTKLVIINFPHNPTGALPDREEFKLIVEIARENDLYLFSDEMYRLLEYNPENRLPSACDLYEKAISLFGASKTFSLAGLRIGWLITQNTQIYDQLAQYKDYTTICNSAPSEILTLMALRAKENIINTNLKIINNNLQLLDDFFKTYTNYFTWIKPKAGSIGFPRLNPPRRISEFCREVMEKKGVLLLPGDVYDYHGNHFRIGFGRANMEEALLKLEEYL